jgi:hypothetical protein
MDIHSIPLISVSYNSAELVDDLLRSFRTQYPNHVTIIDGSSTEHVPAIEAVCAKYPEVKFIHFDYNIHHGPGMAWAYQNLNIQGPVMVLDSDVLVLNPGLLEALVAELKPGMYGVGYVNHVNERGFDVDYEVGAVRYLHPACMLCNIEVVRSWPMPTKHGAPNIEPMLAIHRAGKHELIKGVPWVKDDFSSSFEPKHYLRHDWQGTVRRTGGYHLEDWQKANAEHAKVLQLALMLMPSDAGVITEVGVNDASLGQAYKKIYPFCNFTTVEVDLDATKEESVAVRNLVRVNTAGIGSEFFQRYATTDCWVLNQLLERMARPEDFLAGIRKVITAEGCVVAVIPNAQHWSVQAKLCIGDFRYADAGLMHKSTLRWFTRATLFELFKNAGFTISQGYPVIHNRLENVNLAAALKHLSASVGADPELAFEDAQAYQYVVKAIPV